PGPRRLGHRLPALKRLETPIQEPFRLALLGRDVTHGRLVETLGRLDALDLRLKAVLVLVDVDLLDLLDRLLDSSHFFVSLSTIAAYAALQFVLVFQAASAGWPAIVCQAATNAATSSLVVAAPMLMRIVPEAISRPRPIASSTWLALT